MELSEDELFQQVKRHLLKARGVDLSGYSQSFVARAIRKRIGRSDSVDHNDYLRKLQSTEEETTQLLGALSINVTEFFRDRGAFEAEALAFLDWVQASVHGGQRMPARAMTARVLEALRNHAGLTGPKEACDRAATLVELADHERNQSGELKSPSAM